MRRVREHGLQNLAKFSNVSEVDEIINDYISHGSTTGEVYLRGHFRALG
jgi:hypothetical protein